jgi:hypothetical protein
MARDTSGKWVQRAGATGGGRTYRGQVPANWYAALALIVVIGIASIAFARYEYRHSSPASAASVPPTVGQVWYSGFQFDLCGTQEAPPPASPNATTVGLTTSGDGVIQIAPKTKSEAGLNATLGRFVSDYPGMTLTQTSVAYPGQKALTNNETCAKGTPDAGKKGIVQVKYWPSFASNSSRAVQGDPGHLKLAQNSLVTIAFAPAGTTISRPPGTVVTALIKAGESGTATTPTTAPGSATTAPGSATTAPGSATTAPGSATTAPGSATTATTAAH